MKLFTNAAAEFEKTMTETQLDAMEAQGLDVGALRAKLAARRAAEEEQARRDRETWQNPTHLGRLAPYLDTPRDAGTPFFKAVAGRAPWFGKKSWLRRHTEGQIVYVAVVHAPAEMWKGGKHSSDTCQIVGLYALDLAHVRDVAWLQATAGTLRRMYEGRIPAAPGCGPIMEMIPDESNWEELRLPDALSGGAEACVRRLVLEDKRLPEGYLPSDGIVPHLYWEGTVKCLPADLYV